MGQKQATVIHSSTSVELVQDAFSPSCLTCACGLTISRDGKCRIVHDDALGRMKVDWFFLVSRSTIYKLTEYRSMSSIYIFSVLQITEPNFKHHLTMNPAWDLV